MIMTFPLTLLLQKQEQVVKKEINIIENLHLDRNSRLSRGKFEVERAVLLP